MAETLYRNVFECQTLTGWGIKTCNRNLSKSEQPTVVMDGGAKEARTPDLLNAMLCLLAGCPDFHMFEHGLMRVIGSAQGFQDNASCLD